MRFELLSSSSSASSSAQTQSAAQLDLVSLQDLPGH